MATLTHWFWNFPTRQMMVSEILRVLRKYLICDDAPRERQIRLKNLSRIWWDFAFLESLGFSRFSNSLGPHWKSIDLVNASSRYLNLTLKAAAAVVFITQAQEEMKLSISTEVVFRAQPRTQNLAPLGRVSAFVVPIFSASNCSGRDPSRFIAIPEGISFSKPFSGLRGLQNRYSAGQESQFFVHPNFLSTFY